MSIEMLNVLGVAFQYVHCVLRNLINTKKTNKNIEMYAMKGMKYILFKFVHDILTERLFFAYLSIIICSIHRVYHYQ